MGMVLSETWDGDKLESFIKGEGIRKRCLGGFPDQNVLVSELVKNKLNTFLIAKDGELEVGFICLYPISKTGYAIHVCLKTIGEKTKKLISMAFNYARHFLFADTIYAMYPKSAKAVNELCKYFGFKDDVSIKTAFEGKCPVPYIFKRLDLNT